MFVRSMAVGFPEFAGAVALAPSVAFAGRARALPVLDAVDTRIDRALRELADSYNRMAGRDVTPVEARSVVPHFRSLVSYRQVSGRDLELADAMRDLVAQKGRQQVLVVEPDLTPLRQGLQHYGIHMPTLSLGRVDHGARTLALDVLEREGAAGFFLDAWAIVDMIAAAATAEPQTFCQLIQELMRVMEAMAALFCVAAVFAPIFGPECFAASVVLAILKFLGFAAWC
jgi:hypothetical protein